MSKHEIIDIFWAKIFLFRQLWRILWLGGLFLTIDSVRRYVSRYREYGSIMNTITVDRKRESVTDLKEEVLESSMDPDRKSPLVDVAFPMLLVCAHSPISRSKGKTYVLRIWA